MAATDGHNGRRKVRRRTSHVRLKFVCFAFVVCLNDDIYPVNEEEEGVMEELRSLTSLEH